MYTHKLSHPLCIAGLAELSLERSLAFSVGTPGEPHRTGKTVQRPSAQSTIDQASFPGNAEDSGQWSWLLPFTSMFSKRRQFAVDSFGRVHLIVGKCSVKSTMLSQSNNAVIYACSWLYGRHPECSLIYGVVCTT